MTNNDNGQKDLPKEININNNKIIIKKYQTQKNSKQQMIIKKSQIKI